MADTSNCLEGGDKNKASQLSIIYGKLAFSLGV